MTGLLAAHEAEYTDVAARWAARHTVEQDAIAAIDAASEKSST